VTRLDSVVEPVFLDHASTTPLDPAVAAAMVECLLAPQTQGNASSASHAPGRAAAALVERARGEVAELVGVAPAQVVFTAGATEADNLAVLGIARGRADHGRHLLIGRTEHKAVIDPARFLAKHGFEIGWLEPDAAGRITPQAVAAALRPDTQLVSVMHANNETGIVNDIAGIAAVCRAAGVLLHTDAAQTAGKMPVSMRTLGADLISVSAHKMYGPKGIGALVVGEAARPWLEPLMFGGPQERGLRPGTPATHQAVGFGRAAAIAVARSALDAEHTTTLARRLLAGLDGLPGIRCNHAPLEPAAVALGLPGLVSLSIEGVEGESLLAALPELAVSSGAACDSASGEPSYVLRALGLPPELAQSTLRIMFGRHSREPDADLAAAAIRRAVESLRAADAPGAPAGEGWVMGEAGRLREGTRVRCYLQVDAAGRLSAVQWRIFGCPHTRAVAASLAAVLVGQPASTAAPSAGSRTESPTVWAAHHGIPVEKLGRLLKVEDALRQALARIDAATESR
jgi:cysteine desulfurase